jgi:hypothetical protein
MSIKSFITGDDTPIGEEWVDDRIEEGKQLVTGAVEQVKAWSADDPDTWTDDALRWVGGAIKSTGNWWQEATADQEGIGDDALRLLGGGVKNTMKVLDAGSYYGGVVGGNIAQMIGFDSRIGGAIGNVVGDVALGGAFAKAGQVAKTTQRIKNLKRMGITDLQLDHIMRADKGLGYGFAFSEVDDVAELAKGQTGVLNILTAKGKYHDRIKTLESKVRLSEPWSHSSGITKHGGKTIKTNMTRFGESYGAAMEHTDIGYAHFQKHGNLKNMPGGTTFVDPKTGITYRLKNKHSPVDARGPLLSYDSLESVQATLARRHASAAVTYDDVLKVVEEIGVPKGEKATEIAQDYWKTHNESKKLLERLITRLNKEGGKTDWSLGHGRAVKALRDAGSKHADMFTNIELETLRDILDDAGRVLIPGNTGRGAIAELPHEVNTMLNRSFRLREDVIKSQSPTLKRFWPQMRKMSDKPSYMKEVLKRDRFVQEVEKVFATLDPKIPEAERWRQAGHEVMDKTGMFNIPQSKQTRFPELTMYETLTAYD